MTYLLAQAQAVPWPAVVGMLGVVATLLGWMVRSNSALTDNLQEEREWWKAQFDEVKTEQTKTKAQLQTLQEKHNSLARSHNRLRHYYAKIHEDLTDRLDSDEDHNYPHVDNLDTPEPPPGGYFQTGTDDE